MIRIIFFVALLLDAAPLVADDFPQFRGPSGDGLTNLKNVPLHWKDNSDNIAWQTEIPGLGWSSPVVVDNEIWLTAGVESDATLRAICLDLDSGKITKNVVVFDKEKFGSIHAKNSHASPTPLIDGDLIFVDFGDYGTACLTRTGEVKWRREFVVGHLHGPGGSPALFKDRIFLNRDGTDEQYIIALNKQTGETIWQTKRKHTHPDRLNRKKNVPIAYSTPVVHNINGRDQVLSASADHLAGYDCQTGEELWWSEYDGYSVVPKPLVGKNMVFFSSCYNSPVLYGVKLGGAGDVTKTHVAWSLDKKAPHNPSPLLVGDELYFVSDDGVAHCLNAETGEVYWKERIGPAYSASPFLVGDRIYFQDEKGGTVIIKAGKEFEKLAENQIEGRTLATPTPIEGGLLIRTDTKIMRINAE